MKNYTFTVAKTGRTITVSANSFREAKILVRQQLAAA